MGKKIEYKYFVIVNPDDSNNQGYMFSFMNALYLKYPHLTGKLEVATSPHVRPGQYYLSKSFTRNE